jgi:hypothetical protein
LPVERRSSAAIDLARPVVKEADSGYVIEGYLTRQFGAATTAHSHAVPRRGRRRVAGGFGEL